MLLSLSRVFLVSQEEIFLPLVGHQLFFQPIDRFLKFADPLSSIAPSGERCDGFILADMADLLPAELTDAALDSRVGLFLAAGLRV